MDITEIVCSLGSRIDWTAKSDIQKTSPQREETIFNKVTQDVSLIAFRYITASGAIKSYFGCTEPPK